MTDAPGPTLPPHYGRTRDALHRVATHVLARRRHALTGRFGLRPTPGGFGTPQFGDPDHEEQLRVSGATLVRERRVGAEVRTTVLPVGGATLARLADAVDVDLAPAFSVGTDTPEPGDLDAPLTVDPDAVAVMADFLHAGAIALDRILLELGEDAAPGVAQLWPEHFDLGIDVAVGGSRVNLGASVGDAGHEGPYVYVGPWTPDRPGDAEYWNAPFGALLGHEAITADPVETMVSFVRRGLALLG
jgi:hypothetical protein